MRVFKNASVIAAVFMTWFVGSARAQEIVDVKVPFSFVVQGKEFPAGQYEIRTQVDDHDVLAIRGTDNHSSIFVIMIPARGPEPTGDDQPAIVFTHHEGEYRLSEIWESGTDGLALAEGSIVSRHAEAQPGGSDTSSVVIRANRK